MGVPFKVCTSSLFITTSSAAAFRAQKPSTCGQQAYTHTQTHFTRQEPPAMTHSSSTVQQSTVREMKVGLQSSTIPAPIHHLRLRRACDCECVWLCACAFVWKRHRRRVFVCVVLACVLPNLHTQMLSINDKQQRDSGSFLSLSVMCEALSTVPALLQTASGRAVTHNATLT